MVRFLTRLISSAAMVLGIAGAAEATPVLLISLDGLRPADVTNAQSRGLSVPHLSALMREGAYARGVVGVLPTLTYPSHTTLVTGVAPAVHGIANNLTFDPFQKNQQGWYWYAADVKAQTLWQAAHDAGLRTANVHWPVTVAARGIDYNLPQIWRTGTEDDRKLLAALVTPGLLPHLEAELGPYEQGIDETVEGDTVRAKFAERILAEDRPALTTVYLAGIDHEEHHSGPDSAAAKRTIERTDAIVGELADAARAAMPDITIAVVSDHGFLPVATDINLLKPFIDEGLVSLDTKGAVTAWQAEPWFAGGSAAIMLAHPDDPALVARVRRLLDRVAADPACQIDRVLDASQIAAAGGPAGASFMVAFRRGFEMGRDPAAPLVSASTYKGMHGYPPDYPEMRSTLIVSGPTVRGRGDLGLIDMRAIAPSLARVLGVRLDGAPVAPAF